MVLRSPHGGNIHAASRELGRDLRHIVDFSASINPLGPPSSVWRAISNARRLVAHYPDPESWELRQRLATRWNRDPEEIVVGNGSTELIHALPSALNIRHLLTVQPTFSKYATSMKRVGGDVSTVSATRSRQYAQPIDELCHRLKTRRAKSDRIDGVMLCNPNSPSGQACTIEEVRQLADIAQWRGTWVILDEAFVDYCPDRSFLPSAVSYRRIVVLRSLTKFYALPGLRVGYAVAHPSVMKALRCQMPPWSVNVLGQVAALAAVNDQAYARRSIQFMDRERERFGKMLSALPGCWVMPTSANYVLVELPRGWHAREVTNQMRKSGLLIRDCSAVPGATSRSIRVAVRARRENARLIQALSNLLQERRL